MIIAIANPKGGSGKSTVAISLASVLRFFGHAASLFDADIQGTTRTAMRAREDFNKLAREEYETTGKGITKEAAELPHFWITDGLDLHATLLKENHDKECLIVDVGGFDGPGLRATLAVADLILIPVKPDEVNVWAMGRTAELVNAINAERGGVVPCMVFFNDVPKAKEVVAMLPEFREYMASLAPWHVSRSYEIGNARTVANAVGTGRCVWERRAGLRSKRELKDLMQMVLAHRDGAPFTGERPEWLDDQKRLAEFEAAQTV